MKTALTTLAFGVILMLGANQPSQAGCGGTCYTAAPTCATCWDPYYNNYAHNYYGQGLFSQIVNSLR